MTLFGLLSSKLPGRGDHPVLVDGRESLTYGELHHRAEVLASWLADEGVGAGDRLGIHLPKCLDEAVITLAAARLGAVFVNLSPAWTRHQVAHAHRDCELSMLFTDARGAGRLASLGCPLVAVDPARGLDWSSLPDDRPSERTLPGPDDLAALLYTSGSTGSPRGVMLTHRNIVDGAEIVAGYLGNAPEDRILGLLPMSFDYGLNQLATMLHAGGTLVLQRTPFPSEIVRTVRSHDVTGLALVPPSWIELVRYLEESGERLGSLRYLTNTGGKIPDTTLARMPRIFPGTSIHLMYGLTESFRSTSLPPDRFADKTGAIGWPVPGVQIYVVDPDRGLCATGEVGELLHAGKLVSRGYWNAPEATAERIRPSEHLRELIGDRPVVHSGDLVRCDEDGCLWFEGRRDEMIKSSGYRMSPTEIEEIAYSSRLVDGAIAFGVDDARLGQRVHLAVEVEEGGLDMKALSSFCRRRMPAYMIPELHPWPGRMPRTASGKLDRKAVIRAFRGGQETDDESPEEPESPG